MYSGQLDWSEIREPSQPQASHGPNPSHKNSSSQSDLKYNNNTNKTQQFTFHLARLRPSEELLEKSLCRFVFCVVVCGPSFLIPFILRPPLIHAFLSAHGLPRLLNSLTVGFIQRPTTFTRAIPDGQKKLARARSRPKPKPKKVGLLP